MRDCWSSGSDSRNYIAPGIILLGVLSLAGIIGEGSKAADPAAYMARLLTLFCVVYAVALFWAFISARTYQVNGDGLVIRYPFGIKRLYPWKEIKEITLCKIHYASGSNAHTLGIRCAMKPEVCVPKNAASSRASWSSMVYELYHFRELVSIYYTEDRYAEFEKYCPYPIKDLRKLRDRP